MTSFLCFTFNLSTKRSVSVAVDRVASIYETTLKAGILALAVL